MWFFRMKFGNNCILGGHFYTREEMFDWFNCMLKQYTFKDKFYDLHIYYDCEVKNEEKI